MPTTKTPELLGMDAVALSKKNQGKGGFLPGGQWMQWPSPKRIKAREVSCREVMDAFLNHIDRINPMVNAIVSCCLPPRSFRLI